jgi:hypothetical protein
MAINLGDLARGTLSYGVREPALDDIRFDRIRSGFSTHYIVHPGTSSRFSFERGEGYPRVGKFDAFTLVDSGSVERVRDGEPVVEVEENGNVIPFGPRFGWLRFSLNIRSILFVWALLVFFTAMAVGGDWLFWLVALIALWTGTIVAVQRSLKAKVRGWLERGSWN